MIICFTQEAEVASLTVAGSKRGALAILASLPLWSQECKCCSLECTLSECHRGSRKHPTPMVRTTATFLEKVKTTVAAAAFFTLFESDRGGWHSEQSSAFIAFRSSSGWVHAVERPWMLLFLSFFRKVWVRTTGGVDGGSICPGVHVPVDPPGMPVDRSVEGKQQAALQETGQKMVPSAYSTDHLDKAVVQKDTTLFSHLYFIHNWFVFIWVRFSLPQWVREEIYRIVNVFATLSGKQKSSVCAIQSQLEYEG